MKPPGGAVVGVGGGGGGRGRTISLEHQPASVTLVEVEDEGKEEGGKAQSGRLEGEAPATASPDKDGSIGTMEDEDDGLVSFLFYTPWLST